VSLPAGMLSPPRIGLSQIRRHVCPHISL
jgi:hypothetical protein